MGGGNRLATQSWRTMPANDRKLLVLATVLAVTAVLYWAQAILIPLALATLLAFLLSPLAAALERWGLGRIPAVILVVVLTVSALGAAGWGLSGQAATLLEELPKYTEELKRRIAQLRPGQPLQRAQGALEEVVGELEPKVGKPKPADPVPVIIRGERRSLLQRIPDLLRHAAAAGLVVVLSIFLLIERHDLRDRFIRLVGYGRLTLTTKALDEAGWRISRYLMSLALVNAGMGLAFGLGLWLLDVPYAIVWGVVLALARFIPYVGVWPAAALPIVLSLTVFDGWVRPLLVAALFLALELVVNVAVEPVLYSQRAGVSKVALLVAVGVWTWLWGPIGLIFGTPFTVCLAVLAKYVPTLDFLSILIGDEPAMEPRLVFYQRLIAGDLDEATEIAHEQLESSDAATVADGVLIPALVTARGDRAAGRLEEDEERTVVTGVRDIVEGSLGRERAVVEGTAAVRLLGCAARDEADAVALEVFRRLLPPALCEMEILPAGLLASEVVARVGRERTPLVTIASLPPGGLAQTRYLVKRLRAAHPDVTILVGRWGATEGAEVQRAALTATGADQVGMTVTETRDQLLALLPVKSGHPSAAAQVAESSRAS
jgi:predicted PurR-regulated permease PerM